MDLLGGRAVETIRPAPIGPTHGYEDADDALRAAGGVPSGDRARPLVVVVNDPDRATDTVAALKAIRAASPRRAMRIVVATGSHRWSEDERLRHQAPLMRGLTADTGVVWHDALNAATMSQVGPARLANQVAEAVDLIAVGSVEPHWFAGLTGAHKTLTVGVMHHEDIAASHVHAMEDAARPFRLLGNPVHQGFVRVIEALQAGRRVVALNHVGDRWFGGAPLACLLAAAPLAQSRWLHRAGRPFDFLVAVVEPPLSRTLYQAEKGVKNNEFAVADGGAIVLDAECGDGVGPGRFYEMLLAAPDVAASRARIAAEGYRLGDHKAHRLRALQARGVRIALVSKSFPKASGHAVGIDVFATREDAAKTLSGRGAVVEDAGNMVVVA